MSLLQPAALLGLLTIPIILLLHLFRNRRKELPISSLRLWRDLEKRKQGAMPRRIPITLMLILQLCMAGSVTLALARPATSFLLVQPKQTIFILDMSTSMNAVDVPQARDGQRTRFDVAREQIQNYVETMAPADSVAVISLDPTPQILFKGDAELKPSILNALNNLTAGANGVDLATALTLTSSLVDPDQENRIVVLTDGNYTVDSQLLPAVMAPLEWQMIPAQPGDTSNQTLLDVSARQIPDGRHRLFARVVNYGDTPVNRTLRLTIDDLVSGEDTVTIEPQSDVVRVWTVSKQAETAGLEIVEPDILPLDNLAELLLFNPTQNRVLLISSTPDALAKALEVQPGMELTVISPNETYSPADFDLVIFDSLPSDLTAWPRGNVLVINPPLDHPLLPGEGAAENIRPEPDTASALFSGIDLSGVFFNRVPHLNEPDWAAVDLRSMNTEAEPSLPLVFQGSVGDSRIVVWAFDLESSNLPARLALPLLTANTLSALLMPSPPSSIPVGQSIELASNFNVETPDGHQLFMDSGQGSTALFANTSQPGLYIINNQNNVPVAGFAVHAGSPLESNMVQRFDPQTVTSLDASAPVGPDIKIDYKEFWPWLAALALIIVVFEGWLAWRK